MPQRPHHMVPFEHVYDVRTLHVMVTLATGWGGFWPHAGGGRADQNGARPEPLDAGATDGARESAGDNCDQPPRRTDRDTCRDCRDRGDDGRAVADPADRPAPRLEHRARHDRAARQHVDAPGPRLLDLPLVPADRHAVPARAQRVGHAARVAARLRGQGHRGLRSLRGRRLGDRRPGDLPHSHRDPVHRDHERCRPRCRGRRPVHPRRDAR